MPAWNFPDPDLPAHVGLPRLRRRLLPGPVGRGAEEQQVAVESGRDEVGSQQMIVPGDLVHIPNVMLLEYRERIAVAPQEFNHGGDTQRALAGVTTEVLHQS